jgi:hypothetical protein
MTQGGATCRRVGKTAALGRTLERAGGHGAVIIGVNTLARRHAILPAR